MDHQRLILILGGTVAAYLLLRRMPLPRLRGSRSLMVRLVVYGALGIFLMPWVLPLVEFVRSIPAEGWRQIGRGVQEAAHVATPPTRRPCSLIGVWSSTHRGAMRRIEAKTSARCDKT